MSGSDKKCVVVPGDFSSFEANRLYGEDYGYDWIYETPKRAVDVVSILKGHAIDFRADGLPNLSEQMSMVAGAVAELIEWCDLLESHMGDSEIQGEFSAALRRVKGEG